MNEAIDRVDHHLGTLDLRYRRVDENSIELGFNARNLSYAVLITGSDSLISFVSLGIMLIPDHRLEEVIRLVNLLNATRLRVGSFWVRPDRRALSFEVPLIAPGGASRDQVELIFSAMGAIDHYYPAFARVVWGGMSAEPALEAAMAESADRADDSDLDLAV